jgi:putative SOS response-associated peptidase YedK
MGIPPSYFICYNNLNNFSHLEGINMCGHFVLLIDLSVITESFDIQNVACEYRLGNNISSGQQVSAVNHDDKNRLVNFRRGLIPSWAKDPF